MSQVRVAYRWKTSDLDRLPDDPWLRFEIIDGELIVSRCPHLQHSEIIVTLCSFCAWQYEPLVARYSLSQASSGEKKPRTTSSQMLRLCSLTACTWLAGQPSPAHQTLPSRSSRKVAARLTTSRNAISMSAPGPRSTGLSIASNDGLRCGNLPTHLPRRSPTALPIR